jgi:hypothetical protein
VTITTRQLVGHLAGIRHYEKPSNSSSKNKETASKEVKDKKNVSLLLVFVDLLFHATIPTCWPFYVLSTHSLLLMVFLEYGFSSSELFN